MPSKSEAETPKPYFRIDLDWVWGPDNPDLTGVAILRATISDPTPHRADVKVTTWLASVAHGKGNSYWEGGWALEVKSRSMYDVVIDLISGGQDVADSLGEAVKRLQDGVVSQGTTISWEPQAIRRA